MSIKRQHPPPPPLILCFCYYITVEEKAGVKTNQNVVVPLTKEASKINVDVSQRSVVLCGRALTQPTRLPRCWEQEGYDHSYFFVSSFMDDHVNMHADRLMEN